MSSAIALGADGDICLDSAGRICTVSGAGKLIQDLTLIVRSIRGSCPFNTLYGMDDVTAMHSQRLMASAISSAVLQHPDVMRVDEVNVSKENRTILATIKASLIDGTTVSLEVSV